MRITKRESLRGIAGIKASKKIANNTYRVEYENGNVATRLHFTDIITVNKYEDIILNSGGWKSLTTKARINEFTPFTIYQKNHVWYVSTSVGTYDFYDGMTFDFSGCLISEDRTVDLEKLSELKKAIKKFCNLLDNLESIPQPSGGDCWNCHLKSGEGESMGDVFKSVEHLQNHIEEGYIHGSLLVNALLDSGYRREQVGLFYHLNDRSIFKRSLRKYLIKKLV